MAACPDFGVKNGDFHDFGVFLGYFLRVYILGLIGKMRGCDQQLDFYSKKGSKKVESTIFFTVFDHFWGF